MPAKKYGRAVHGVLVLNKPPGISSNTALQKAKRALQANKAGHTGSLDPMATGVLPLCFGEATKFSQYLLDADKTYESTFCFGQVTSTADAEGEVLETQDASHLCLADIEAALPAFEGAIEQVPPMVSALKVDGQPLYKLAREGKEIERKARPVTIHELDLLAFRPGSLAELDVRVHCTKGTYIRSIAHDLGQVLKVGGHVARLHRIGSGPFDISQAIGLEALLDHPESGLAALQTVDSAVAALPTCQISADQLEFIRHGRTVELEKPYATAQQGDKVRIFCESAGFLGIGELVDVHQNGSRVAPKRLVVLD